MTGHTLEPFQRAVYAQLSGDSELNAQVSGIFDQVPYDAALPYLVFTSIGARSEDGIITRYERVVLGIHSYSQAEGRKESDAIITRASELLHRQKLTLSSGDEMVWQRVTRAGAVRLADGKTWRGEIELTALIERNE